MSSCPSAKTLQIKQKPPWLKAAFSFLVGHVCVSSVLRQHGDAAFLHSFSFVQSECLLNSSLLTTLFFKLITTSPIHHAFASCPLQARRFAHFGRL